MFVACVACVGKGAWRQVIARTHVPARDDISSEVISVRLLKVHFVSLCCEFVLD